MKALRAAIVVCSIVGMVGLMGATTAGASGTAGTCAAKATVTLSPGITNTASSGTFKSSGGQIACVGTIANTKVGGIGTLTFSGSYGTVAPGDTCAKGAGAGTLTATVPKVGGGTMTIKASFTFTRVGADVVVQGKLTSPAGPQLKGDLAFIPAPGQTCFTTAVKSATVAGGAAIQG